MTNLEKSIDKKYEKVVTELDKKCNGIDKEHLSYGYGVRHLQTFLIFSSLCIIYIARAHISATIVAMTDVPSPNIAFKDVANISVKEIDKLNESINNIEPLNKAEVENVITNLDSSNSTNVDVLENYGLPENETKNIQSEVVCIEKETNTSCQEFANNEQIDNTTDSIWNVYKIYAWPKSTQEMVLGSFFLGYMIMMSPMGLVCQRWGGKIPLQISLFSSALITILTPWLAILGDYKAVCISRVAIGLTQAGTYPSVHTLIAKWVPVSERGRLGTYIYTGSMVGTVLAYHVSGFLSVSILGWPSVFWVTGTLCLLMGLMVTWLVTPSPQQHRYISDEEKNFILGGVKDQTERRHPTPWKAIMTSKPVLACFVVHLGTSVTFLFMFSQIPTYLHHAVGLNIKNSGLLSSLPYLSNFFMSICMGIISDYCINRNIMSMKLVRIISTSIANIGPALGMFALTFISNPALAVSCLIFCMGTHAGTHTGWMVNYIDLSPNFSGTLMATGNTFMNVGALLLPVLVSKTVIDVTNVYQWRIVLFVVGSTALVCNTVYVIFMSADIQPWNEPEYQPAVQEDPDTIEDKINIKPKC